MTDDPSFVKFAAASFPWSCRQAAFAAAEALAPAVDSHYRRSSLRAVVEGRPIRIPKRIHFVVDGGAIPPMQAESQIAVQCLLTRSTNGYVRHASLRTILPAKQIWVIPFVVLLAGEHVVEIIEDILNSASTLDPNAYVDFVRENRALMRLLRSKAARYWNCYYRDAYPNRHAYPGLAFLHRLERWAA